MKLHNLIMPVFAVALTLTSCSESFLDREPTDALSDSKFWKSEKDADEALTGCYHQLYSPYRPEEMWSWDTASDNAFCYHNNKDYRAIGNGSMAASGVSVHNYFTYEQIRTCNEYLKRENTIAFSSEAKRLQYRAEVRMIRVMSLFFRVQCYGDFPFSEDVYETIDESRVPRVSKDKLLDFCHTELKDIIKYLSAKAEAGRITSGAAKAYLVRLDMYMHNYAEAAQVAKEIMQSGLYAMPKLTYEQSFLKANQYNSEVILSFEHNKAGGFGMWVAEFFPNSYGGWSSVVPTQSLLNTYETRNGLTIDEDPTYDARNPFVNRDPRLRATILYPGQVWDKYADTKNYPHGYPSIEKGSGDYWSDADNATHTGMNFKKFYSDPSEFGDIFSCDRNFPILRYAEVLLSYAEAKIELGQIDASVYDAINQVRHRAGMPNVDETKYNTQETLRTLVRRERRVEFAYEGLRRFDLQRWGIMDKCMPETIYHMNGTISNTINAEGDHDVDIAPYGSDIEEVRHFTKGKNELLPVPQTVIDVNPLITQNPNY
ncbi:MAG: RagB/SusD family nutrient uptake outer membrane protein [Prevotella sp.]|nr:RagB/SusD family nutrient uptake outer membrane protein [Prevotella sp.]